MSLRTNFLTNENGAVAATYAIAITGLVIVAGAAFDYNRLMALDSEMQTAADNAALAAVTQLDQTDGSCARAANAAVELLRNISLMSNDGGGNTTSVNGGTTIAIADDACGSVSGVVFYEDADKVNVATTDEDAKFVEVTVDPRRGRVAFTSLGDLFAPEMRGVALAGLGSAICEVPPLMICSPDPTQPFDADNKRGIGVQATGNTQWAPGNFGFLEVGSGQLNELANVIAYGTSFNDCIALEEADNPETGNAQVLYEALNSRLDIRPGGGGTLSGCANGLCPGAINSVTDLIKQNNGTTNNQCRLGQQGWKLPATSNRFDPRPAQAGDNRLTQVHNTAMSATPQVMGLTRDLCHYTNYGVPCTSVNSGYNYRFGNGHWAIADYFAKYHPSVTLAPPTFDVDGNAILPHSEMTRYEVYLWEISTNTIPDVSNGFTNQYGRRICQLGASSIDRRVLTVAIVTNCDEIRGGSTTADIDEWADVFMVAPVVDENTERTRGREANSLYVEIIRTATLGGGGGGSAGPQSVRRDKPYLIE
ncbi:pilus assembly protein TadG-related protein [Erythrobacter alti]|uniref:pilus assembly protein TadG-related protein n=1 Tax=Erythrobacter alti TaxID=1896145 RepID=UPI0030F41C9C